MNALLLALLVSSPLMTPATPDAPFPPSAYSQAYSDPTSAPDPKTMGSEPEFTAFYICSPGEVWRAFYYRQSQSHSSPECGLKYWTCEGNNYQEGCQTPYYTQTIFCGCP
jgi:hypothetical protein